MSPSGMNPAARGVGEIRTISETFGVAAGMTVTLRSSLLVVPPSLAEKRKMYAPGAEKLAVVSTAVALAKVTVPGPLTWLHVVLIAPGGLGSPSSVTVPSRVADAGRVIVWSAPAFTEGAWFVSPVLDPLTS